MGFNLVLGLALVTVALGSDLCPAPKDILPCTCDDEGINCMDVNSLEELKKAFNVKYPYGGVRSVWLQGTTLKSLTANVFGKVFSQQFYVEQNDIDLVDIDAFSASRKTLIILSFYGNKIIDFPYSDLDKLENLASLNLGGNLIETIPSSAFTHDNLRRILLPQNKIKHIGMNAFANLKNLEQLELGMNQITELGPLSLAMRTSGFSLQIGLQSNQISEVAGSAFQGTEPQVLILSDNKLESLRKDPFFALMVKVATKGGIIEVAKNPFTCKGCDFTWIEQNKEGLQDKLVGFNCTDGRSILDLTRENVACV